MHPLCPFIVLQWLATGIEPLHIAVTVLPPAICGQRRNALAQLDQRMLSLNASPGGAADLLAATLFIDRVCSPEHSYF